MKFSVQLLGCAMLITLMVGCSKNSVPFSNENTKFICSLWYESCMEQSSELAKNPVSLSQDGHEVTIYTVINCGDELNIDTIKQEAEKIIVTLKVKEGGLACGGELRSLSMQLEQTVSLETLEVYEKNKETIYEIYPNNEIL